MLVEHISYITGEEYRAWLKNGAGAVEQIIEAVINELPYEVMLEAKRKVYSLVEAVELNSKCGKFYRFNTSKASIELTEYLMLHLIHVDLS